jgi:hypothetical protein
MQQQRKRRRRRRQKHMFFYRFSPVFLTVLQLCYFRKAWWGEVSSQNHVRRMMQIFCFSFLSVVGLWRNLLH